MTTERNIAAPLAAGAAATTTLTYHTLGDSLRTLTAEAAATQAVRKGA